MSKYGHLLLLITCGLVNCTSAGRRIPAPKFAGPYSIVIRCIGNNTDEYRSSGKLWTQLDVTPPKAKKPQHLWGLYYGGMSINDNLRVEVRISQWSNNEWKKNAFVMKFNKACGDALYHAKSVIDVFYEPHERRCPLPKVGLRMVKNTTFNPTFPHFPIMPYNRYLFTVAFIDKDETVGVLVVDGNIIPK